MFNRLTVKRLSVFTSLVWIGIQAVEYKGGNILSLFGGPDRRLLQITPSIILKVEARETSTCGGSLK
jgi:hypothetical protein